MAGGESFVRVNGVDGNLYNPQDQPLLIYAIANTNKAVVVDRQTGTLRYYQDWTVGLRPEFNPQTGERKFYLDSVGDWTLQDKSGHLLPVASSSVAFSNNGQWLVVDAPNISTLRVDLDNQTIVPFSWPFIYRPAKLTWPHMAISDDGRTAATAEHIGNFIVTDIDSCEPTPVHITMPVTCNFSWADSFVRVQVPGYQRVYDTRFSGNSRISVYVESFRGNKSLIARYVLTPPDELPPLVNYLALGDSFSSGEGAFDYFLETDSKENKCHTSKRSYPYLIGLQLSLKSYNSVACSGARMQDIITYAQKQNVPTPNTMGRLLPGFQKQIQYVSDLSPNVVTVGVGGNDMGFNAKMKACISVGTCYKSYEDRLEIVHEANRQFQTLLDLYNSLKNTVEPGTKLYVIGYPHVAKADGDCAVNVRLDNQELMLSNQLIDYLNQVIATAAARTGLRYTDVSEAFSSHKMCETTPSQVAFNGVTAGDDKWGIFGNESFHPNYIGHQLYKQTIIERTTGFTQSMPTPNPVLVLPPENSGLEILRAPRSNRVVRETTHDESIADDVIVKGGKFSITLGSQQLLLPNSRYKVELHSDPVDIGTLETDKLGMAQTTVNIPKSVPVGFHTLHIFGNNRLGADIDIYKTVYIAASLIDYDGDGMANTIDECKDQPDSGNDTDGDGIDDVCDVETGTLSQAVAGDRNSSNTIGSGDEQEVQAVLGRLGAPMPANTSKKATYDRLLLAACLIGVGLILFSIQKRSRKK